MEIIKDFSGHTWRNSNAYLYARVLPEVRTRIVRETYKWRNVQEYIHDFHRGWWR